MDGTETGWGRPAEPAPRWRALLDRALLGSKTGEQRTVGDDHAADDAAEVGAQAGAAEPARPADLYAGEQYPGEPYHPEPRTGDPRSRAGSINPLPTRPVNPLDRRHRNPLDHRPPLVESQAAELSHPEQSHPVESQPSAPWAGEPLHRAEARPPGPLQRPVNPLDSRRHRNPGEGYHGRAEAEAPPHSYFNPTTRPVPPPITRVTQDTGYPPARAAASVGSAAVLPPPTPAPAPAPPAAPPTRALAHAPVPVHGQAAAPIHGQAAAPATRAIPTPASPATALLEWRQAPPAEGLEPAVAVLRRKLGRPRVLAFANPKGGVHKTTATVLAAATIGSVRGRGVLAWDDNELRGTLGLRAGSARHARTIRHLVSDLMQMENLHGDELIDRLDDYLRHASDGSYDVLAGEENPRFAQRLDQHTVGRVTDLLRRTHDVICVDTGNNVESVNWQTVMKAADQLVITTVPREDAAFTADWMLDLLEDIGMQDLVANAVTLISCPSAGELPLLDDFSQHFATRTRAVTVVPYDPALEVGSSIEYSLLQPETRQAWLRAAAVMIEPFVE